MYALIALLLVGPFGGPRYGATPGRRTDTSSIVGDSLDLGLGIEWTAKVVPKDGRVTEMVFTSQRAGANGTGSTARLVLEIHATETTLCYVDIPCTLAAGQHARATTAGACDLAPFSAGDVLHMEWSIDDSHCLLSPILLNPQGSAVANLSM